MLSLSNDDLKPLIKHSLTDYGLCVVLNGNSINQTFALNERMAAFTKFFDNRTAKVKPLKIKVQLLSANFATHHISIALREPFKINVNAKCRDAEVCIKQNFG